MYSCPICKIDFKEDKWSYQRHFGFSNAKETRHQTIKENQEKIAIELFNTDLSGDTYHILNIHPEIDLISEKVLRKLWKKIYGSEAIEKRRAKISAQKNNEKYYEPIRQQKILDNPNICQFCSYRYSDEKSYVHHLGAMNDDIHKNFLDEQEKIIVEIYKNDKEDGYGLFKNKYPEIKFGDRFIGNIIRRNFTKKEIQVRKHMIKSKKAMGNKPWNAGETKDTDERISQDSENKIKAWSDGKYSTVTGKAQSNRMREVRKNDPSIAKHQSETMVKLYADGLIQFNRSKGGIIPELGHYVRSSWEKNFALILKYLNIPYEYESKTFPLYDEYGKLITTYTPDFRIKNGIYYELKGVFESAKNWGKIHPKYAESVQKITLFRQQYPHLKLRIIGKKEYNRLIKKFFNKIPSISYIKDNRIHINKEQWAELNNTHTKAEIKDIIIDTIENNNLPFPYKEISLSKAAKDFKKLIDLDETILLKNGEFYSRYLYKHPLGQSYISQSYVGLMASDYFQQINRVACDGASAKSPIKVWNDRRLCGNMLNYMWSMKKDNVCDDYMRGALRLRTFSASQFKPSVAKYIYNTYGNKGSILDFSAGWGDRLAGFYASNCESYVGIDPNKAVFDKYSEQVELYETIVHKEVQFINAAAEDIDLGNKEFDLVFTSPPYFDVEKYSDDDNQSWKRYKTLDEWLEKFLFKTLKNSWDHLKIGGYMVINISDAYSHGKVNNICDPMNDFISTLNGAKYVECLGMRISKKMNTSAALVDGVFAEPMWIWQKIA